jgi:hypothetical protein
LRSHGRVSGSNRNEAANGRNSEIAGRLAL